MARKKGKGTGQGGGQLQKPGPAGAVGGGGGGWAPLRDSIRRERNKVAVWEYFDEGVKAWRVLNRD